MLKIINNYFDYQNDDKMRIIFVKNNEVTFLYGNREYQVSEDTVFLIAPNIEFKVIKGNNDSIAVFVLDLNQLKMKDDNEVNVLLDAIIYNRAIIFNPIKDKEIVEIVKSLEKTVLEKSLFSKISKLYDLIDKLYNKNIIYFNSNDNQKEWRMIDGCYLFVEKNYDKNISIKDLSKQFNYSDNYFASLFKKYQNESFNQYVLNFRLEKSISLLKQNLRIVDVANKVGFNSESYYIKQFKKKYGVTPSLYREQYYKIS
ncbi:MAG: AraC family transcriptional regulator [Acholeplasma sp.]|nr:AraC family transcriptional regulator [Acholeplasma sp.]